MQSGYQVCNLIPVARRSSPQVNTVNKACLLGEAAVVINSQAHSPKLLGVIDAGLNPAARGCVVGRCCHRCNSSLLSRSSSSSQVSSPRGVWGFDVHGAIAPLCCPAVCTLKGLLKHFDGCTSYHAVMCVEIVSVLLLLVHFTLAHFVQCVSRKTLIADRLRGAVVQ